MAINIFSLIANSERCCSGPSYNLKEESFESHTARCSFTVLREFIVVPRMIERSLLALRVSACHKKNRRLVKTTSHLDVVAEARDYLCVESANEIILVDEDALRLLE